MTAERRNSVLARVAFEAVWERDMDRNTLLWDGNLESMFGYRRDEVGRDVEWWSERVHRADVERVLKVVDDALRGAAAGWSNEYRFLRRDGSWAWVSSRCAIERDDLGQARHVIGAMIDVSNLKDAESRLRLFTEQIPARATVTDRDLRVLWDTGVAFSSTASAVGKTVPDLFAQSPDRERVLAGCRAALTGESSALDIDDGTAAARLHLGPFHDPAGNVTGVVGVAFDITDRVRSEQRVREAERLLRQVIDTLPVGVGVLNAAGDITLHNPALREIWGGTIVRGDQRWATSKGKWHDSGREIAAGEWASCRALTEGEASRDELIDIETYLGDQKTIENYAAPVRDAHRVITGAVVVHDDVTQRVRAEETLRKTAAQLERLSRKLIEAQETERRAIARELHDDFGQVLTALKLNLQRGDRDADSIALVDGAIARMRDLAQSLRPPLLDERGLDASLAWYAEREAKRAGVRLRLAITPFARRLPVTLEAAAFRIAQEALTNVLRHAAASAVEIELTRVDGALQLIVRDDGRGFDVAAARRRALDGESHGLINMQERATLAGGDLEIASSPGGGTSIRVRLPLSRR